jgi:hypothetical protein
VSVGPVPAEVGAEWLMNTVSPPDEVLTTERNLREIYFMQGAKVTLKSYLLLGFL